MNLVAARKSGVSRIGTAVDGLSTAAGWLCGIFLLLMTLIVFLEVVLRFAFNRGTIWSLEVTEYLVVMTGFIGAAYVLKEKRHIVVDVLTNLLVHRTKAALEAVNTVLVLVYSLILAWYGTQMLLGSLAVREVSASLVRFPMWIPKLAIPVGGLLLVLQAVRLLVSTIGSLGDGSATGGFQSRGFSLQNPALLLPLYVVVIAGETALMQVNNALGLILLVLTLLFGGVPVAFGLGLAGCTALFFLFGGERTLFSAAQTGFSTTLSFVLAAIPMFILGASVMGGVAKQLYDVGTKWAGHLPGGLAVATMVACGIFASISGSTIATAAAIGIIALPQMLSRGYDKRLSYGTVAAGGVVGSMIPPGLGFILIGAITKVSVGKLFIAGILPGILMVVAMSATIILMCRRGRLYEPVPRASWKERFLSLKGASWGLLCPVIIIGGIYTGIFTPTEAAAVAVIYGLLAGTAIMRTVGWREFRSVVVDGARTTAMLLFVIVGAMILGHVVTLMQIPQTLVTAISEARLAPWMFMALVVLLLQILGTLLEAASTILLTVPILFPVVMALGLDPIWFGVVFNLNLEIAMITPPVGITLYTVKAIAPDSKMGDIIIGAFPFVVTLFVVLLIVLFVPQLSTWLPGVMMGK